VADSFAAGLVGVVLDDRYRLDALVGEGGMGAVFRATHLSMDRRVAVKLLKPHLTSDTTQLQRFAREARSTLKVDSPHAVKVLDFGVTPQRDYYMVLEYLDGRTVQRELDIDGPFAPARAVHITRQALHALGTAHQRGLVHRDVKPDNLLLMRVGADPDYTKVLDFGVAKLMEGAARSDQSALALTQMGMVFGTPEFMSPEQACGHSLDGRSDLYSLAATLFAMVTGCGLFDGKSAIEWLTHHARTPPPHLTAAQPGLAAYPELDEVLQRCLAKQRDLRPRDAAEMDRLLAAIEPTLGRAPGSAPPAEGPRGTMGAALKAPLFSPSSYLAALPPESVASGETLAPGAAITSPARPSALGAAALGDGAAGPPETLGPAHLSISRAATVPAVEDAAVGVTVGVTVASVPRRSRSIALAIAAIAAVAMIGVALGLALTRRPSRAAAPAREDAAIPAAQDAAAPLPGSGADAAPLTALDAGAPDAGVADAQPAPPGSADAGVRAPPSGARKLLEHLRAAEEARRTGNRIGYLVWSEAAYKDDPHDVRARLTYADALIVNGSKERGCAELRALKRIQAARERAAQAECPTD
jgi:serine/threonine protein kinase